jgi:hypothetical protein
MARDASGKLLDDPEPRCSCPSILWAARAGIDPAVAPELVEAALADPRIRALLGMAR